MKLITIVILGVISNVNAVDYCTLQDALCLNHVACGNNGQFAPNCPTDAVIIPMDPLAIQTFLDKHNTYRNKIAVGENGLTSASQMMKLNWDNELAYLAELNVKTCKMQHDKCRKTQKYSKAGQNLYWMGTSANENSDVKNIFEKAVESWYSEMKDVTQADINICCGGIKFNKIGHYSQLARDKVVAIGCAASKYSDGHWKATLIACNYSYINIIGSPIYISGPTASACTNGKDEIYTNLCKN